MKTRFWQDGTRITVFVLAPDSRQHDKFCTSVLGISTVRFEQLVNTYLNSGNAPYFRQVRTPQELFYKVAAYPGAIGYVDNLTFISNISNDVVQIKILDF